MELGISTACFYPLETENALEILGQMSIPMAEVFVNTDRELEEDYCHTLRQRADQLGIRIRSLHPYCSGFEPFLFFSNYPRRFEDGRQYYKKIYRAAAVLGADLVVFHGGWAASPLPWEEYFTRYALLMQDAQEAGVTLAHENVARCVGSNPEFFRQMHLALPEAAFVLDVKQAIRSGVSPYDMAQAMGPGVQHLHISDHSPKGDCLLFGEGELDLPRLVQNLDIGNTPSAVLELYQQNWGNSIELCNSYKKMVKSFNSSN